MTTSTETTTETTSPIRAAIYSRISADADGQRSGVERQREDCERLAQRNGWDVVAVLEDNDISAFTGEARPDFERLIEGAQAGDFDVVICWASDRLYRRMIDLVRITTELAPHVTIATVMGGDIDLTTAEGIRNAQQAGSYAEYESRRKSERVAARARQRAEKEGRATTSMRPFGWAWVDPCPGDVDCQHRAKSAPNQPQCAPGENRRPRKGSRRGLTPHPIESQLLVEAYRRILARDSLRATTRWLRDQGVVGTTGAALESTAVKSALLMPRNAGLVAHRGDVVAEAADGHVLVDRATWERARTILTDPARRTSPVGRTSTPLGGGLLSCGKCGGPMSASNRHDPRAGTVVPVYVCSAESCYFSRRRALLDGPVLDLARGLLGTLSEAGVLAVESRPDPEAEPLRARLHDAEQRLETLRAMTADGDLDPADFKPMADRLRASIKDMTGKLNRKEGRPAMARLLDHPDGVLVAFDQLVEQAHAGTPDGLRAILRELFARVEVKVPAVATWPTSTDVEVTWRPWVPAGAPRHPLVEAAGTVRSAIETRRAEVAQLRAEGLTINAIAERLGVYRATVRRDLQALAAA